MNRFESRFDDFDTCYQPEIDPKSFHIEHNGHQNFYSEHYCPICAEVRTCSSATCSSAICRDAYATECLTCATRELISDTERFSKEAREFLKTELPTDDQTLIWWRALRAQIDGKLKGLAERAAEVGKRQDKEN